MKTLKVNLYQNDASYSFSANVKKDSLQTFVGTSLNHFFTYVSVSKKVGSKSFSFNKPINLHIEVDGLKYDTGTCDIALTSKLKCQRTSKGFRLFASRCFEIIKFSTVNPVEMTLNDLLESL